jgi:hypothetical protein
MDVEICDNTVMWILYIAWNIHDAASAPIFMLLVKPITSYY